MARVVELPIPAAVEAERVLLGAILNDADQLLPVLDILPPVTGDGLPGRRTPPWIIHKIDAKPDPQGQL
jgi:hypothetical protein